MKNRVATGLLVLCATLISLVCVSLLISVSNRYMPPKGGEVPNLADWLQGWGSIAGVLTGVLAAITAGLLLRQERANTRRAEKDAELAEQRAERSEQRAERADLRSEAADLRAEEARTADRARERRNAAEQITYYLRSGSPEGDHRKPVDWAEGSQHLDMPTETGTLFLVNNSGGCAYRLIASVEDFADGYGLRGLGVVPPGTTPFVFPMKWVVDRGSTAGRVAGDYANSKLVPWIEFVDSGGVAWRRHNDGLLEEVAEALTFPDYSW